MMKDNGELSRDIEEDNKTASQSLNVNNMKPFISNSLMKTMDLNLMERGRHLTDRLKYLQLSRVGCLKTWSKRMKSCKGWKESAGIVSANDCF
jgi:hypothetical protein